MAKMCHLSQIGIVVPRDQRALLAVVMGLCAVLAIVTGQIPRAAQVNLAAGRRFI
jgi:hypothetical protein